MTTPLIISEVIKVISSSSNSKKQDLGRRFALHLGLQSGEPGPDDGIDGYRFEIGFPKIHFQCKLRSTKLGKDDARLYYSDLDYHKIDISIYLSGLGYKDTFRERLNGHRYINDYKIHLLTLDDLFQENLIFQRAAIDLPPLRDVSSVIRRFNF